jgi:pimeloyl-ACP methyl ester carboxylesterase
LSQMLSRLKNPSQVFKSWYIAFFQLPILPEVFFKKFGPKALKTNRSFETITPLIHHYRQLAKEFFSAKKYKLKKDTPVLVLWGKNDPFLIPPTEEEIKKLAENFSIRILDGGHWLAGESPQKVNSLIETFLETGK